MVKELGHPIISTSAMFGGAEVLYDPAEIDTKLGNALDLVIDGGVLVSEPSSVIDLTGDRPTVLRQGKGDVSSFL
jgi:tRNA A37 threonylcarbamoyladenosine synthetase subunit TsaC/SUA5/YrdC